MQSINDILSKELQVKPLLPGEKVEFQLCLFGQFSPILNGPNTPSLRGLASRCDIFDPFDKKAPVKMIMNIKSLKPIVRPGQETLYDPQLEGVHFGPGGRIICTHLDNHRYMYLMRHNKNRDNPYRDPRKEAVYFVVNEKKELTKSNKLFEYKTKAGFELLKAANNPQLIAVYASRFNEVCGVYNRSLKIDIGRSSHEIYQSLQNLSQSNPAEMMLAMEIEDMTAMVMIDLAVDQRWIVFNDHDDMNQWEWLRTPGQSGPKKILSFVVNGPEGSSVDEAGIANKEKELASYLVTKEGSSHFAELKMRYSQYYTQRA